MPSDHLPDALLLITAGCAHCPVSLDALTHLVKDGAIGRLEIVNVAAHPEYAEQRGVRAVPWTLLGEFELEGALTLAEMRLWAQRAGTDAGMAAYLAQLLGGGQLARCVEFIKREPARVTALLSLLTDPDTVLDIRIGINAVLEELRDTPALTRALPQLGALTTHAQAAVRADACHALSFSTLAAARPYLEACLHDTAAEVRDIAAESLASLEQKAHAPLPE
ncbi:MAG: HEAT repeat domain-containing protein [Gammaproteobacteria bacterium]